MNEDNTPHNQENQNEPTNNEPPTQTIAPEPTQTTEAITQDESPKVEDPQSNQPSSSPPATNKSRKKLPLLIMLCLIVLVGAVGAWYVLQSRDESSSQQAQPELKEIALLKIGSIEGPVGKTFPSESSSGVNVSANVQLYEGLVENVNGVYRPLLAESWTNPDQSTWVFKLKPNVTFQTGKTMTAADVVSSINSLADLEFWSSFTSTIASVEETGELEVTIKTTSPDPLLLNRLSRAYIRDVAAATSSGLDGTGAYKIDTTAENSDRFMRLVSFDEYHGGVPLTKAIEYIIYDDEEKVTEALLNGDINVHEQSTISSVNSSQIEIKRIDFEAAGSNGIYLNLLKADSPLQNIKVREAIAHAVNRDSLITELEDPELIATHQMVPKSLIGYVNDLEKREHSIETSKQLLSEAGYTADKPLTFIYFEGVQLEPPVLIEQLRAAGFTINAVPYTSPDEMFAAVENKEFDLFTSTYTSDISDARDVFGSITLAENPIFAAVDDSELDKLLAASDAEFDPTKRTEALQAVNRYIHKNVLWLPIRNSKYITYYHGNLSLDTASAVEFSFRKYRTVGDRQ